MVLATLHPKHSHPGPRQLLGEPHILSGSRDDSACASQSLLRSSFILLEIAFVGGTSGGNVEATVVSFFWADGLGSAVACDQR